MPNCCNRIIIEGDLNKIKQDINEDFDNMFSNTIPLNFKKGDIVSYFNEIDNKWSTESNPCEIEMISNTSEKIEMTCQTVCCPPQNWAKNCIIKYKGTIITIIYCEIGCEFYGKLKVGKGIRVSKQYAIQGEDLLYDEYEEKYVLGGHLKQFIEKNEIGLGG